ncbi:MAG: DUF1294 domain-containing protein [Parvibaculum sp.]|nr:DUF1294 domain-containing protein [Parvibaculum sp.]
MVLPVVIYLVVINAVGFGAFGWDKHCAERGMYRLPERTLLMIAVIGGAAGSIAGQRLFRHKTRKEPFRTYLNLTVLINIVGFIALSSPELRERILSELMR